MDNAKFYFDVTNKGLNTSTDKHGVVHHSSVGVESTYALSNMIRHRKMPKVLLPTSASFSYQSYSYIPGFSFSRQGILLDKGQWGFCFPSNTYISKNDWDSADDAGAADLAARAHLSENIGQFGEDLFSLKQTGDMIFKRGRQIAQMARDLSRGNWRGLGDALKGQVPGSLKHLPASRRLADGWLELQFGWIPLVGDVYAAVDAYRNKAVSGQPVQSYGRIGKPIHLSTNGSYAFFPKLSAFADYSGSASVKYYGQVSNPTLYTLNQLGLANPLKLAWDLMPYSFVVDWFLPIGQILAYLGGGLGLGSLTRCTVTEWGHCYTWSGGGGQNVYRRVNRVVSNGSILPDLTKLSSRSLGIWHAITAGSLVRQSFRR